MAVRLAQLSLATLADMDPRIEALFQSHIARIAMDCKDRPNDESARVLTMKFSVIPVSDPGDATTCDDVTLDVSGSTSLPTHKTKTFQLKIKSDRVGTRMLFNQDIPDDIDQTAIPFERNDD